MGIGTAIAALQRKLIDDINGAGLPPAVVELVLQPILAETHTLALGQLAHERQLAEKEGAEDAADGN